MSKSSLPKLRAAIQAMHPHPARAGLLGILTRMENIEADDFGAEKTEFDFDLLWDALLDEIGAAAGLR